jgi:hypothetical protein
MDPLSDVLSLLKPRSYTFGGYDVGGDFSLQFPAHRGIKCYAVLSGQRWLAVEGVPDPVLLTAGDECRAGEDRYDDMFRQGISRERATIDAAWGGIDSGPQRVRYRTKQIQKPAAR